MDHLRNSRPAIRAIPATEAPMMWNDAKPAPSATLVLKNVLFWGSIALSGSGLYFGARALFG